jgi:hypothetical protein
MDGWEGREREGGDIHPIPQYSQRENTRSQRITTQFRVSAKEFRDEFVVVFCPFHVIVSFFPHVPYPSTTIPFHPDVKNIAREGETRGCDIAYLDEQQCCFQAMTKIISSCTAERGNGAYGLYRTSRRWG